MFTIKNILDRYRSISVERINEFLTNKCIEHQRTELHRIEFRLEDLSWDLYVEDNYFNVNLVFPVTGGANTDKYIDTRAAQKACVEVSKLLKVLKVNCSSHEYVDKENNNELAKRDFLIFSFETFCYNMFDFSKLFYDAINIIISGYKEYHKCYDNIESKLPGVPIGFRQYDSEETIETTPTINRHRVGFV